MLDWLARQARERPEQTALIDSLGKATSFGELEARTAEHAQQLAGRSVGPGATIFALMNPGLDFLVLLHAARRIGATFAIGSTRWTRSEVDRAMRLAEPGLVVADASVLALARRSARVLAIEDQNLIVSETNQPEVLHPGSTPTPQEAVRTSEPVIDPDKPCTLLFTSGSSGKPKAIIHSAANFMQSTAAGVQRLGTLPQDVWLAAMPLHHIGGLSIILRSTILGTAVHLQDGFDPEAMAEALLSGSVTQASVVPAMLDPLVEAIDGRPVPQELRFVLVGGALATHEQLTRAQHAGLPVAPTYGMTETTSQIATARPTTEPFGTGEVGIPLEGTELRVVDAQGRPHLTGTGALEVRGPIVALGRISSSGRRESLVNQDGWMSTKDRGVIDASGAVRILGRVDDVIVTGGENVAPEEVEAVLLEHPDVAEVAVVGRPDTRWGMAVTAVIVPVSEARPDLEGLRDFAAEHLARYKLPHRVEFCENLPRTASGKLQRYELR